MTPAHTHPYSNPSTNEDKAEALHNEQRLRKGDREATTLHKLGSLSDDLGGRYAVEAGQTKAVDYPPINEGPYSNNQPQVPPEMPLGVAIDQMETTGEFWEIQRSIAQGELGPDASRVDQQSLEADQSPSSPAEKREATCPAPHASTGDGAPALASNSRARAVTHVSGRSFPRKLTTSTE